MASRLLVINDPLCYLLYKYSKTDQKTLKTTLLNFYQSDEISAAKDLLFSIVCKLPNADNLLKNHRRRDSTGNGRSVKEIDDIFAALTILDENNLLLQLPIFVTDDPTNVPTSNIGEGDMRAIMNRFERVDILISHLQDTVNKSIAVATIKPPVCQSSTVTPVVVGPTSATAAAVSTACSTSSLQPARRVQDVNKQTFMNERASFKLLSTDVPPTTTTGRWEDDPISSESLSVSCDDLEGVWEDASRASRKRRRTKSRLQGGSTTTMLGGPNFTLPPPCQSRAEVQTVAANAAATVAAVNRFDSLSAAEKNNNPPAGQRNYAAAAAAPGVAPSVNRQGRQQKARAPILVGNKRLGNADIMAAKPYIGKSIYCIDNVKRNVTEEDMMRFVDKLGVTVLTCHSVPPRRSKWQKMKGIEPDRKTFRLCVPREESEKLLNADVWPAHIVITAWRFSKKKPDDATGDAATQRSTDGRLQSPNRVSTPVAVAHGSVADADDEAAAEAAVDMASVGANDVSNALANRSTSTPTAAAAAVMPTAEDSVADRVLAGIDDQSADDIDTTVIDNFNGDEISSN